ncbi:5'(3')-deoxyribonucleotidase [Chitinophaga horti]|uniref:5'(3')-deoxyribonucleotidase n=1 Tax=Chitinophaga horti TaxID=2920382 RepID=A0ABY6IUR9_9BACT|nr:5'(3')-deoxyribonucleotidase [Chitinophaga horti]UYQ91045.1 5'(3')-deoxyribonucleotidase [Chitinophaga horti]
MEEYKESIAIDMDETIADPIGKARDWYYRDFGTTFTDEDLIGKHLSEVVPEEHKGVIHQYLNTPGFFRDLKVFPDAVDVLRELNKKYRVFIVSAAMEFPASLQDKYYWLEDNFPFLTWRQVCLCGDKTVVGTDMMIDDLTRNLKPFKGRGFLFTQHHNLHVEGYERLLDWADAGNKLL